MMQWSHWNVCLQAFNGFGETSNWWNSVSFLEQKFIGSSFVCPIWLWVHLGSCWGSEGTECNSFASPHLNNLSHESITWLTMKQLLKTYFPTVFLCLECEPGGGADIPLWDLNGDVRPNRVWFLCGPIGYGFQGVLSWTGYLCYQFLC